MAHETFISHSSEDKVIADAVTAALEQANIRCWIAPRDIRPGDSWGGAIVAAIESSRVMVVIFSAKSNASKQVMREVERAVQHDVVVVPFRIEDVQPTRDMEYFLSSTHWLDAMSPEMDAHLQELSKTVANILDKATDEKVVAKASKKAAAGITKGKKVESTKSASKFSGILTGVMVAAVLGLAALFFFSGDSDQQNEKAAGKSSSDTIAAAPKKSGDIKLKFEDTVRAGGELPISWSGKHSPKDYIAIVAADAADNIKTGNKRLNEEESITMEVPDQPGDYQVRYFDGVTNEVIANPSLQVKLPEITLNAPEKGIAGTEIDVAWTGPNDRYDQLAIAEKNASGREKLAYAAIAKGSPTSIRLPDVDGEFELRYVSGGEHEIWKTRPIEVVRPEVSIEALPAQVAGAEIEIKWQGPANRSDYLAIAEPGMKSNEYRFYSYLKQGQEAKLRLPAEAGNFELRYVSGQSKEIWAVQPIALEMPTVSVTAPTNAKVGDLITVNWEGPANKADYVSIATPDSDDNRYEVYKYLQQGKKTEIQMPEEPGDYEIRYVSGAGGVKWFAAPFEVLPRNETLEAPEEVKVDDQFTVSWSEEGYGGQYIGVFLENAAEDDKYLSYAYTRNKTKTKVRAPKEAGDYELRYMSGNKKLVWARRPLKVVSE